MNKPTATIASETGRRFNILLAEDNVVNQRVAKSILEKRGHLVQPVNNGREALDALACESFDVVLMDVQMPEMGGLEATAAIRQKEQETGWHVPIIAMTAHALKGDRERCLEAGMDDYLSKPVEPKVLCEMIERWSGAESRGASSTATRTDQEHCAPSDPAVLNESTVALAGQPSEPTEVFDIETLRTRVEDDLELLSEMIDLYLSSSPQLLADVESAVAARDGDRIARAAHTLKGVLKNMCAASCADAALKLELMGKSGDFAEADQRLVTLKREFLNLQSVLHQTAQGAAV
jgi:CheY-like chemotaxis protein/HPt (histidine-containing phosphotransfer) domain-containing protein